MTISIIAALVSFSDSPVKYGNKFLPMKKLTAYTKPQLIAEIESLHQRLAELEQIEVERQQLVEALRESEANYRILLDESSDPIFMFDSEGQYRYVNQAFADGVGKPLEKILGQRIWDVFSKDEADKRYAAVQWVFEHAITRVIEVRVPREDGDRYYITTVKPILNEQEQAIAVICISKDITDRKHTEEELCYLSTHDTLTGLYNRAFFEGELARLQLSRMFPISIVVADMDNLKIANDRYGHTAGDELIRSVALILRRSFRSEDIIARIGGDEFAIVLPETDQLAAENAVQRLRINLGNQSDTWIELSLGLAVGAQGEHLHSVMRLADDRMYQDKLLRKKARDQSLVKV
jgi:diguanylate cyclase (GGDEF)-like protein/PAS domain S-box-containing protein